jgi:hypothetical protein
MAASAQARRIADSRYTTQARHQPAVPQYPRPRYTEFNGSVRHGRLAASDRPIRLCPVSNRAGPKIYVSHGKGTRGDLSCALGTAPLILFPFVAAPAAIQNGSNVLVLLA